MKKIIYILFLTIFFSSLFSQEERSLNIFVGHQQMSTKNIDAYSDYTGGTYFGVSKNLGFLFLKSPLNFGFQFSQRGGQQPIDLNDYLIEGNIPSDDIEKINILLSHSYFDFFINTHFSLGNMSFYFGPMVGINLGSDIEEVIIPEIYDLDTKKEFEPENFDWGINYGITFHVNRFIGLSLESYQGGPNSDDKQFRNFGLKLSVGL
tara:strand:- start:721 stop:1338 length:618 start_codon:yes stop_codon:yes gene_type:complete